jgi:hypothetical protein
MKRKPIVDRDSHKETLYYTAGKMKGIPGIGEFPSLVQRTGGDKRGVLDTYRLAAITDDFVFYVDVHSSEDITSVVMINRQFKFITGHYLAHDELFGLVQKNEGLLWISTPVKQMQRDRFIKPDLLSRKVKEILNKVVIEELTNIERDIYYAYLENGPVKYTKPESIMAVLSNDLDEKEHSDQLLNIIELLKEHKTNH